MNVIFLTMSHTTNISSRGIYSDLLRKFHNEGHSVYIIAPYERRMHKNTSFEGADEVYLLGVKTLNLSKANLIEKGVGQILVEGQYKRAIKRYLSRVNFDLILYSTPPITLTNVIKYLKYRNANVKTYLLLKDIFPQNAVDLGMMYKNGAKGIIYRFFRKKEKQLYFLSDHIGCMSPANVKYLLAHNQEILSERVELAPNSLELCELEVLDRDNIRRKYDLPLDRPVFIYGGNLGKPQGISFFIDCMRANDHRKDCHFLVVGNGTELPHLKSWYAEEKPMSVTVLNGLSQLEYDKLVRACDVGLIFLDHRFTIPNYPSRLLNYLESKMPVLCATDPNTDIGRIAQDNGYGYWCESNSVSAFTSILDKMITSDRKSMGEKGYEFLKKNYLVEHTYNAIMRHV